MQTHTHIHPSVRTYMHTYIHTYIQFPESYFPSFKSAKVKLLVKGVRFPAIPKSSPIITKKRKQRPKPKLSSSAIQIKTTKGPQSKKDPKQNSKRMCVCVCVCACVCMYVCMYVSSVVSII